MSSFSCHIAAVPGAILGARYQYASAPFPYCAKDDPYEVPYVRRFLQAGEAVFPGWQMIRLPAGSQDRPFESYVSHLIMKPLIDFVIRIVEHDADRKVWQRSLQGSRVLKVRSECSRWVDRLEGTRLVVRWWRLQLVYSLKHCMPRRKVRRVRSIQADRGSPSVGVRLVFSSRSASSALARKSDPAGDRVDVEYASLHPQRGANGMTL